jgi:GNAT superfamily N-acetyltransferase
VTYQLRLANPGDIPVLRALIAESARILSAADYTSKQIEAALEGAWGVDTQLIRDGTFLVVEAEEKIVGCGGWSFRRTLFGGDALDDREPARLDPASESARIRAFFVRPDWARRGIGRALLERCEAEASRHGFKSATLVATLPGERLYRALGYVSEGRLNQPLPHGQTIEFVPMRKPLLPAG